MKKHYTFRFLLLFILLNFTSTSIAAEKDTIVPMRNAYEVAQALYTYKKAGNKGNRDLREKFLGSLIWYAGLNDNDSTNVIQPLFAKLSSYNVLGQIADDIFDSLSTKSQILQYSKREYDSLIKVHPSTNKELNERFTRLFHNYKATQDKLRGLKSKIDTKNIESQVKKESKKSEEDSLKACLESVTDTAATRQCPDSANRTITILKLDTAIRELDGDLIKFKNDKSRLISQVARLEDQLIKFLDSNKFAFHKFLETSDQKLLFTTPFISHSIENFQQASSSGGHPYYNRTDITHGAPSVHLSQSEWINALAIYIAKRMKQEAVMWFFENLTRNASTHELLRITFPSVLRLLQNQESHEIPNMGAQWQYALSKDFIEMPKNVLKSKWLEKRCPELKIYESYLTGACDIAALLMKKHSYREIIKALYLNNPGTRNADNIVFGDFIQLLYAVNTEFFVSESAERYRLLKFEDYRLMSREELEIMISLVDLKYGNVFGKFLFGMDKAFALNGKITAEDVRQLLGKIELAVQKVESVREDYLALQKKLEANNEKDWFFTAHNVWEQFNQLLTIFDESESGKSIFNEKLKICKQAFQYTGQLFEIYNLISKKNFSGAIQNAIILVDTLLYSGRKSNIYTIDLKKDSIHSVYNVPMIYNHVYKNSLSDSTKIEVSKNGNKYLIETFFVPAGKKLKLEDIQKQKVKVNIKNDKIHNDSATIIVYPGKNKSWLKLRLGSDTTERIVFSRTDWALEKKEKKNGSHRGEMVESINYQFKLDSSSLSFSKSSPMAAIVFESDRHALKLVRKLGGFLNDAALAQNDKQLAKVVESYAMPAGSYKRKRNNWWSLDLTALAGAYTGYEWIDERVRLGQERKARGFVYGFSVPIGISLSKTFGYKWRHSDSTLPVECIQNPDRIKFRRQNMFIRNKWTTTVTVSLIDLGAVVSYRIGNSNDPLPQKVEWAQLISPGLHIGIAIPGTPLMGTVGGQYTPRLRKFLEPDKADIPQYNAFRVYLGLMFDLPLFNLWEQKRIRW